MNRFHQLDSLRGLAALAVVISHYLLILQPNMLINLIEYSPLRIFVASSEAVTLFFVLSGFVLTLPLLSGKKVNYIHFITRRFLRIYIPYYVSLIIVIFTSMVFYSGTKDDLTQWFNYVWSQGLSTELILQHIFLLDSFANAQLNPVLWSLVHEMRISLIFPIIVYIVIRFNWKYSCFLAAFFTLLSVSLHYIFPTSRDDYINTIFIITVFIVGSNLAKYHKVLTKNISEMSNLRKSLILLGGLFIYLYVKPAHLLLFVFGQGDEFIASVLNTTSVTLGASIIIMMSLGSIRFKNFLLLKPILFLGKISYSLYLYHCIFLFSTLHLLYGKVNLGLIWLISFTLSIAVSWYSYKFVEKRSINLGKKLNNNKKESIINTSKIKVAK